MNIFLVLLSFSSPFGTLMIHIFFTDHWGSIHVFFCIFSLLFRLGEFYSSVLKFTDFIICYSYPIFEPFQWDFYFCYLATFICNNMSSQKTNKINNIFKLWGFTYSFLIITLPIYFCLLIVLARTIIKMLNSRSYTIFNLLKALLKILWKFYQKYHLFHVFFFWSYL